MLKVFGLLVGCVVVASCGGGGGGGNSTPPPPPMFTVGGTVSGLAGTGLVLENNGGNPLTVNANGAITFTTSLASGSAYNVTVRTQPTATPAQACTVSGGSGMVGSAAVTSAAVQCRVLVGRFVYVPTVAQNGVAAFTINANDGSLTPMAGSPFATTGQAPRVLFADRAGKFLYVFGDDNIAAPGPTTLTGFTVDPQTGTLTAIPGLLENFAAATPAPAALHPNGSFVYVAVTDGALSTNNRLHGFAINATTGALTALSGFPWGPFAAGEVLNSVVLSPLGASLYLASSTPFISSPTPMVATGRIARFTVDSSTGALSETMPPVAVTNNSFNGLFMHPAGTHMYTRNSTSAQPWMYASRFTLDAATGAIDTTSKLDIATAFGFGLVIAPAGRVYFAEFGGNFLAPAPGSVAGYVDAASGPMVALPGSPYSTGGTNSLAQALDPAGRFLALTNLGSANVTVMRIDAAQGSLAHVAGSPYTPAVGTQPGSVTFDPSARFAYLTDGSTSSISSYSIDASTGIPTYVSSQPMLGTPGVAPVTILGRQ